MLDLLSVKAGAEEGDRWRPAPVAAERLALSADTEAPRAPPHSPEQPGDPGQTERAHVAPEMERGDGGGEKERRGDRN